MTRDTINANYRDPDIDRLKEAVEAKRDELMKPEIPCKTCIHHESGFMCDTCGRGYTHYWKFTEIPTEITTGADTTQDQPQPEICPNCIHNESKEGCLLCVNGIVDNFTPKPQPAEPRLTAEEKTIHLSANDGETREEATELVVHKLDDGGLFIEWYMRKPLDEIIPNDQAKFSPEARQRLTSFFAQQEVAALKSEHAKELLYVNSKGFKNGYNQANQEWKDRISEILIWLKDPKCPMEISTPAVIEKLESLLQCT